MLKCLNVKMMKKGVTLVEMLVAVTVFSITIGAISGIFISGIRTQRRVLATQELLDQTSYVLEYTGRALRMAKKELNAPTCLSSNGLNYEKVGDQDLRFKNYEGICQRFFQEGVRLKEQKGWTLVGGVPTGGTENYLISDKLQINSLKFNFSGEAQPPTDNLQPRVTIFLEILGRETGVGQPKIQIQTSVSQRDLDIQY